MALPTHKEFTRKFPDDETTIQYLRDREVFYTKYDCPECQVEMKKYNRPDRFVCTRRSCTKRGKGVSSRIGTFFYTTCLPVIDILSLAHMWLCEFTVKSCIVYTGHSPNTVCTYFRHFRKLVTSALTETDSIIGGEGVVIEIDETKLGKRKYNRGHRVDGVWVVVGIERGTGGGIFLAPVPDRTASTLRRVIEQHVRPGTQVHTDGWRGYTNLEELGLDHIVVNHSQAFVDPTTGGCTNTAEGLNSGLKRKIPVRNRVEEGIEYHLGEYVWRRQNKNRLFDAFVEALRDVHFEVE